MVIEQYCPAGAYAMLNFRGQVEVHCTRFRFFFKNTSFRSNSRFLSWFDSFCWPLYMWNKCIKHQSQRVCRRVILKCMKNMFVLAMSCCLFRRFVFSLMIYVLRLFIEKLGFLFLIKLERVVLRDLFQMFFFSFFPSVLRLKKTIS